MPFVEQVDESRDITALALASSAADEAAAASGAVDWTPAATATIAVQRTRTSEVRQRPTVAVLVSYTFMQADTVQVFSGGVPPCWCFQTILCTVANSAYVQPQEHD